MPDVDAIIRHGFIPDTGDVQDEPDLLVQGLTITPKRTKKEYIAASTKATAGLMYTNPQVEFGFDSYIGALSGLADQHPGTAVDELVNFSAPIHGFDPEQGMMVYEDPVRNLTVEDSSKSTCKVVHYPFVAAA